MDTATRTAVDLGFAPVPERPCKRLTREEVAQYNREGFVQPFAVFPPDEIAAIRAYFDTLMAALGPAGAYGINCYQARMAGIWDIATDPRILDLVEDITGPDIICWASAILSKAPNDPKRVPWHQDASFWQLSPARTVTVWLAIDDADAENSAMRFLPRTHDKGIIKTSATDESAVFHKGIADAERFGAPFVNALKAGQASLHADMLVHGSEPNTSDRRRCGLTLRYCPADVRITDPEWARGVEAILCRGTDSHGHWTHHPRPDNDDITATSSPHVVGNN
ncbi:phytanoyl-CoA dioxygenase family protein [Rhodobacteraceae bacterium N5(2021)]|uniref:Phytanoyl-CoA dioxygenase family protein n=1 Tax=Gymnodinialimonas phycosphaerae TaxID=2841589 RepID=A0A975TXR3_9RHOB|nr:phytanoyl-CoA dioxygenase family protein [Gymnodinialimonas phycosphaerae]MBY4891912.1 phytanoyl-CoA dioxygenase family protein [Gymnodinialimonas phycosphaerae]